METSGVTVHHEPWNKGKIVGQGLRAMGRASGVEVRDSSIRILSNKAIAAGVGANRPNAAAEAFNHTPEPVLTI